MYHATPHSATGLSPHTAMHGEREMWTVFPLITPTDHVVDRIQDLHYKAKMVNGQLPDTFCIGDIVIVKQKKVNKLSPAFNPVPLRITQIKGSTVTAQDYGPLPEIHQTSVRFIMTFMLMMMMKKMMYQMDMSQLRVVLMRVQIHLRLSKALHRTVSLFNFHEVQVVQYASQIILRITLLEVDYLKIFRHMLSVGERCCMVVEAAILTFASFWSKTYI